MMKHKQERRLRKVVNKDDNKRNSRAKQKGSTTKGFYYSFLTIILILCLIQITLSAVLNVSKVISYKAKIIQITRTRDAAQALNEQLKDNISNFSNATGLEAIARNNLKMSSEDEVLVIINTPKDDEEKEDKSKKMSFIKYD